MKNDLVTAQHEETGRLWSGPRSELPDRYFVVEGAVGKQLRKLTQKDMTTEEENAAICESVLGWERRTSRIWRLPDGDGREGTPTFTDWHGAGLILEALSLRAPMYVELTTHSGAHWLVNVTHQARTAKTGPLAIRSAALAYLKATE